MTAVTVQTLLKTAPVESKPENCTFVPASIMASVGSTNETVADAPLDVVWILITFKTMSVAHALVDRTKVPAEMVDSDFIVIV